MSQLCRCLFGLCLGTGALLFSGFFRFSSGFSSAPSEALAFFFLSLGSQGHGAPRNTSYIVSKASFTPSHILRERTTPHSELGCLDKRRMHTPGCVLSPSVLPFCVHLQYRQFLGRRFVSPEGRRSLLFSPSLLSLFSPVCLCCGCLRLRLSSIASAADHALFSSLCPSPHCRFSQFSLASLRQAQ